MTNTTIFHRSKAGFYSLNIEVEKLNLKKNFDSSENSIEKKNIRKRSEVKEKDEKNGYDFNNDPFLYDIKEYDRKKFICLQNVKK